MNEVERVKWERTRQRGMWLFLFQTAMGIAVGIILFELLLGSGYVAIKNGSWDLFWQAAAAIAWRALIIKGLAIGAAVGYVMWRRNEMRYNRQPL